MDEKTENLTVDTEIYERMLKSSLVLRNQIRTKHKNGLEITKEEADFVNDFETYKQKFLKL